MRIQSELSPKQYLREMRRQLGSFTSFGDPRFTGIILGNFFWITYHSGYEWNRRITNEKNRAFGFVKDWHGSTMTYCVRTKGFLDPVVIPFMFALLFCVSYLIVWFVSSTRQVSGMSEILLPMSLIFAAVYTLIVAVATYIRAGITERGNYGRYMLMALLHHPEDPENHLEEYD